MEERTHTLCRSHTVTRYSARMDLEDIIPSEIRWSHKDKNTKFHSEEAPRRVKFTEMERMGGGGLMGAEFQFGKMKKVLETDRG